MDYIDLHNIPENAIKNYIPAGGSVNPDLFDGVIMRVSQGSNFTLERLKNQVDGMKFFLEVINTSEGDSITVSFDDDYRATDLGYLSPVEILSGGIAYYEMICRIGLVLVYSQVGVSDVFLRNPATGVILLNPETGQPLIAAGS